MTNTAPERPAGVEATARNVVSTNVRVAMARKNLPNPSDLAAELGVDRRWVTRRLANEFDYTLADLVRLGGALDASVSQLTEGA